MGEFFIFAVIVIGVALVAGFIYNFGSTIVIGAIVIYIIYCAVKDMGGEEEVSQESSRIQEQYSIKQDREGAEMLSNFTNFLSAKDYEKALYFLNGLDAGNRNWLITRISGREGELACQSVDAIKERKYNEAENLYEILALISPHNISYIQGKKMTQKILTLLKKPSCYIMSELYGQIDRKTWQEIKNTEDPGRGGMIKKYGIDFALWYYALKDPFYVDEFQATVQEATYYCPEYFECLTDLMLAQLYVKKRYGNIKQEIDETRERLKSYIECADQTGLYVIASFSFCLEDLILEYKSLERLSGKTILPKMLEKRRRAISYIEKKEHG